jgi:hypothetical protein
MMLLLDVWRRLKLLSDDPTEHLQRLPPIFWAKDLPKAMQGYPLAGFRFLRKKAPSWQSGIEFLLEYGDWHRANQPASKKRKQKLPAIWAMVQSGSLGASYVGCFWGDQVHLETFLQMYVVEKAKIESRKHGHAVNEQTLTDGSIRLHIIERA